MTVETINYHGWPNSVRIANDAVEVVMLAHVGPRMIHIARIGGANLLGINPELKGKVSQSEEWQDYGGHRLWHGPEIKPWSYGLDNDPVEVTHEPGGAVLFSAVTESHSGIQKQMRVTVASGDNPVVTLDHLLTNHSAKPLTMIAWGVTVVDPGGRVILPHERYAPHGHDNNFLPARPMILWGYTDMSDPRWSWGKNFVQLSCDAAMNEPQKVGAYVTEGWGAYTRSDGDVLLAFIEPPARPPEGYADFGCNFEAFTKGTIQELETLSPLTTLATGETLTHRETFVVFGGEPMSSDDDKLAGQMEQALGRAAKAIVKSHEALKNLPRG